MFKQKIFITTYTKFKKERQDKNEFLNWARIEDWHIQQHNKLSVGRLMYLRNKINAYQ